MQCRTVEPLEVMVIHQPQSSLDIEVRLGSVQLVYDWNVTWNRTALISCNASLIIQKYLTLEDMKCKRDQQPLSARYTFDVIILNFKAKMSANK